MVDKYDLLSQAFSKSSVMMTYHAPVARRILGLPMPALHGARPHVPIASVIRAGAFKQATHDSAATISPSDLDALLILAKYRPELGLELIKKQLERPRDPEGLVGSAHEKTIPVDGVAPLIDGVPMLLDIRNSRFYLYRPEMKENPIWAFVHGDFDRAEAILTARTNSTIQNQRRSKWTLDRIIDDIRLMRRYTLPPGLSASRANGAWGILPAFAREPNPAEYRKAFKKLAALDDGHRYFKKLTVRPSPDDIAACVDPVHVCRILPQEWIYELKTSVTVRGSLLKRGIENEDPERIRTAFEPSSSRVNLEPVFTVKTAINRWLMDADALYQKAAPYEMIWDSLVSSPLREMEKLLTAQILLHPSDVTLQIHAEAFPNVRNFLDDAFDHLGS